MSSTASDVLEQPWRAQRGWRRQGLARRAELLAWLLADPTHQGLSGQELAKERPLYAELVGTAGHRHVMADLRVMEDDDCTVLRATGRPVRWTIPRAQPASRSPATSASPGARTAVSDRGNGSGPVSHVRSYGGVTSDAMSDITSGKRS